MAMESGRDASDTTFAGAGLVIMTGRVVQVVLSDPEWTTTLQGS
jgi:hypothetical protein